MHKEFATITTQTKTPETDCMLWLTISCNSLNINNMLLSQLFCILIHRKNIDTEQNLRFNVQTVYINYYSNIC